MSVERIQRPFGRLTWDDHLGWWESAPVAIPLFGGEKAPFRISPSVEDADAPIEQSVIDVAEAFLALDPSAKAEIEPHVWAQSCEMAEVWEDCPEIRRDALWTYVRLNGVGIDHDDDGFAYVSIECNCDWEPEHGLQLVLQHGHRWVRVSDYSGHFTEGQAWGAPALDAWMDDSEAKLPLRSRAEIRALLKRTKPRP